jgi:hypothetical protein
LENPLLALSVLDYATVCPSVFNFILFLAFVFLSLVPAYNSMRRVAVNSPKTITKAITTVRASVAGKHVVLKAMRATLSRAYSLDGSLGVARIALNWALTAFHQTRVYRLYCWLAPAEEIVLATTLLVSASQLISFMEQDHS